MKYVRMYICVCAWMKYIHVNSYYVYTHIIMLRVYCVGLANILLAPTLWSKLMNKVFKLLLPSLWGFILWQWYPVFGDDHSCNPKTWKVLVSFKVHWWYFCIAGTILGKNLALAGPSDERYRIASECLEQPSCHSIRSFHFFISAALTGHVHMLNLSPWEVKCNQLNFSRGGLSWCMFLCSYNSYGILKIT